MTEENASKGVKSIDLECTGDTCKVRRPERPTERPTEKTTIGSQGNPNKKGILKPDTPIEKPASTLSEKSMEPHRQNGKYAILMETNGQENESWYNFIKYEGNEEALKHLKEQIDLVDFYMLDDFSIFDIDLDNLVSAQTAKEMTKLEVNTVMFHRKFDGKMQKINIKLRRNDDNEDMIEKFSDKLGDGQIEDYVSDEDVDDEGVSEGLSEGSEGESEGEECSYPESEDSEGETKRGKPGKRAFKEPETPRKLKLEHPIPVRTEKGVKFPEKLPADMPKFALRRKKRN